MKILILFLLTTLSISSFAYNNNPFNKENDNYKTHVVNKIYTIKFNNSINKIDTFISKNNLQFSFRKKTKKRFEIYFVIKSEKVFEEYKKMVESFGYFSLNTIQSSNQIIKLAELKSEIKFLQEKKKSFSKQLDILDRKSVAYSDLWAKYQSIKGEIFNKEKEITRLSIIEDTYAISLEIEDETTSPEYTDVSWVNMPGFEYSLLNIETPMSRITSAQYQGYALKYLFTRGKSYFTVGAYKSTDKEKMDSLKFPEIFIIGFGQDFYSRHLGRGSHKFLNLYSGYSLGALLTNKDSDTKFDMYISPSIGLELFKNKYFLIDTKLIYFIPLANNRSLRGWAVNASLNFMF